MEKSDINSSKSFLVITAAGSSTRIGSGIKKEFLSYKGGTVLSEATLTFLKASEFEALIITHPENELENTRKALFADRQVENLLSGTKLFFISGGSTRQKSVFNALKKIAEKFPNARNATVLIHDAARPFVTGKIIKDVITAAEKYGASVPAVNVIDTQKQINSDGTIKNHLVRSEIVSVQTPQGFSFQELFLCHQKASVLEKEFTDDTEIWDNYPEITKGKKVHIVPGDFSNKKITYPEDLNSLKENKNNPEVPVIHTGFGTDLHRLVTGRKFLLGGVEIPSEKGEEGHSDADVLLHAICDAVLGASGLGDIGSYFPPEDTKWKDADSKDLLKTVWNDVKKAGWSLINMDCVVEFEKPKFLPYRQQVIESIADILEVNTDQVFVKAKTNEKQDSIGQGNAIKAMCSCLLQKNNG